MTSASGQETRFAGRSLSLFFPMYNEAENVEESVRSALAVLPGLVDDFEIIVVNDGSRDRTGALAAELAARDPRVRVVQHPVNRGYGASLKSGFGAATRELVFFTDGDLQFDLGELELLLREIDVADVVVGYRIDRQDPLHRRLNAYLWNRLVRLVLGLRVRDVNCAFKLFRREALAAVTPLEADGAMISAELMVKLERGGFRIRQVGVHHYPRPRGQQTGARADVVLKAFRELMALRGRLRRARADR
jgi:glycosyltransferase involved in cell wall biosynthesis